MKYLEKNKIGTTGLFYIIEGQSLKKLKTLSLGKLFIN
jgi:hypothetical protein